MWNHSANHYSTNQATRVNKFKDRQRQARLKLRKWKPK